MIALLQTLLWTAVAAYAVWRFAVVVEQFAPKAPKDNAPVDIPHDLMALALSYPEDWAQEQVIRSIRERYETTNDWDAVRMAFGIGRLDA